jgi:hypothetical protein
MFERSSVRVNPRTPVRVEIGRPGQATALGVVANISDQGACVVTDGAFPIGESLVLHLVFAPDVQPFQAGRPRGVDAQRRRHSGLAALRPAVGAAERAPQHARLRELITDKI